MKKQLIRLDDQVPAEFHPLLAQAKAVYDSSSSPQAKVYFIDGDGGYFLKRAPKGSLQREVDATDYFFKKNLAPEVLGYISEEEDWMLTAKVDGEDTSSPIYLANPKRLCQVLAESMRKLHSIDAADCPIVDNVDRYLENVYKGYRQGNFEKKYLSSQQEELGRDEAFLRVQEIDPFLQKDELIHGDFCLPNIILNDWQFQSFIDCDSGGLGDRHIDLYWTLWSLQRNLGTDAYRDYFLDCYGREAINLALLEAIACFEVFG
ncbi:kanamycin kinase [Streptococcus gallinaceus]|uniref:aminoglycoside 3'-phosphotransferase n=1 Tax=Streptococcus gallinaceus TaxID=165758 RepID=UPI00209DD140|nr:aminoglycoside 3'-phosphotransferase [Streptococcus gallinaceus]MCP1638855.1 kanamycin kinase [Streptococcus gallinaceus]MCP1769901.1 kanamycin kinase [Streptococcus gallinaceus]